MPGSVRPGRRQPQPAAAIAGPIAHLAAPVVLLQVPTHRDLQAGLEAVARLPAQLAADPAGVGDD